MTAPTLTYGNGLEEDFLDFWGDTEGTADSGTTTTTVDTERTEAEDYWNGYYIKYLSGDNAGLYRLITDFVAATDTITHVAFPNAVAAGDEYIISAFQEVLSNMANGDATPEMDPEDVLEIKAVFDGGATDEKVYYEKDVDNILTNTYTKYLIRFKTSEGSAGAKAQVTFVFTSGSQDISLGYSTTWKTTSGTITAGKTLDKIRVYADDDGTDGTFYVYFDFILVHKGTFTFPHVAVGGRSGGLHIEDTKRLVVLEPLCRDGDVIHDLGRKSNVIRLDGDMKYDESWGTPKMQFILDALRNDGFSYFTSDLWCGKVKYEKLLRAQDVGTGAVGLWSLVLREHNPSDSGDDVWDGVDGWLGIES